MHGRVEFGAAGRQLAFAHPPAAYARGHVHEHGHPGGVAVGAFVVGGHLAHQNIHHRQGHNNQRHHGERVEHHRNGTRGVQEEHVAHNQEQRNEHHGPRNDQPQDGQHANKRPVQLRLHLAAVVARHHHHFAAAGARSVGGVARFVLRHHVLADALREQARKQRAVERFQHEQRRCDYRKNHGRNGQHRQEQRKRRDHYGDDAAQSARGIVSRSVVEIFDDGGKARFLLQMLGDVERRLLFFFGAGRPGSYLLGQIRDVVYGFRHAFCLSLVVFPVSCKAYSL